MIQDCKQVRNHTYTWPHTQTLMLICTFAHTQVNTLTTHVTYMLRTDVHKRVTQAHSHITYCAYTQTRNIIYIYTRTRTEITSK